MARNMDSIIHILLRTIDIYMRNMMGSGFACDASALAFGTANEAASD